MFDTQNHSVIWGYSGISCDCLLCDISDFLWTYFLWNNATHFISILFYIHDAHKLICTQMPISLTNFDPPLHNSFQVYSIFFLPLFTTFFTTLSWVCGRVRERGRGKRDGEFKQSGWQTGKQRVEFHVFPNCWNSEEVPLCPTTGYVQLQSVLHWTRFGGKMG